MQTALDLLARTWWTYDPAADAFAQTYHWLNLVEGAFWLAFSLLVLRRYARYRHSRLELSYSLAFAYFGLSDCVEAYALTSWLILLKGLNLAALLWLRWLVLRRYYPNCRTF